MLILVFLDPLALANLMGSGQGIQTTLMITEGKCIKAIHPPGLLMLKLLGFIVLLSLGLMRTQLARVFLNPLTLVVHKKFLHPETPQRMDWCSLGFIFLGDLCLIGWVLEPLFNIQMGFQTGTTVNRPPPTVGWLA
jgi:hypothetical protein